jgi:hypothetical protein
MICPNDDLGCSGIDTSGMDKIDCKDCPRFKEKIEEDEDIDDWNKFMMGL